MKIQTGKCKDTTTWRDIKVGECAVTNNGTLFLKARKTGYSSTVAVDLANGEAKVLSSCTTVTPTSTCVVIEE